MKKIILFLALMLNILLISGCEINLNKNEDNYDTDESDNQIILRFSWWGNGSRHEYTLAAIEKYEELNPHIKIIPEYSVYDGYYQKLITELIGGYAPDVIQIDQPWIYEIEKNDALLADIREFDTLIDLEAFDPHFIDEYCKVDDKVVGLPTGLNGMTVLFDKSMIEEAGIEIDDGWDWDELHDAGVQFKEVHGEDSYMLYQSLVSIRVFIFEPYVRQLSGQQFIKDDYELGFSKDQLEEGFEYVIRLFDDGVILPIDQHALYREPFKNHSEPYPLKLGGSLTWISSLLNEIEGREHEFITTSYPAMDGVTNYGTTFRPSQLYALNQSYEHLEEGAKFLEFLLNSEEGVMTLGTVRGVPASTKAVNILEEQGELVSLMSNAIEGALAQQSSKQSVISTSLVIQEMVQDVLNRLIYREITPSEASTELIVALHEYLSQQK